MSQSGADAEDCSSSEGPTGEVGNKPSWQSRRFAVLTAMAVVLGTLTWLELRVSPPASQEAVAMVDDDVTLSLVQKAEQSSTLAKRRRRHPKAQSRVWQLVRETARQSAQRYIHAHAARYRLGHYVRSQAAGFRATLRNAVGGKGSKAASLVERERNRAARGLYGWASRRLMAPVWLGLLLALSAFMGLMLEERTLPALRVLCAAARIPDDVAGATVLAAATGGFEVLFSAVETLEGSVGVGLDFVLGTGIVNFGLVLPLIVKVHGADVDLERRLVVRDGGFAILAFVALLLVVRDGAVTCLESLALLMLYACHVVACVLATNGRGGRRDPGSPVVDCAPPERAGGSWVYYLLPPPLALPQDDARDKLSASRRRKSRLRRVCEAVAPSLVVSAIWFVLLLLALTRLADLFALSARLPLGFAASVFLPVVYAVPDILVAVAVARDGRAETAIANALGVQVVCVLLGVGLPFTLATSVFRPKNDSPTLLLSPVQSSQPGTRRPGPRLPVRRFPARPAASRETDAPEITLSTALAGDGASSPSASSSSVCRRAFWRSPHRAARRRRPPPDPRFP